MSEWKPKRNFETFDKIVCPNCGNGTPIPQEHYKLEHSSGSIECDCCGSILEVSYMPQIIVRALVKSD